MIRITLLGQTEWRPFRIRAGARVGVRGSVRVKVRVGV